MTKYPEFAALDRDGSGKLNTVFRLGRGCYECRGWHLPLENIKFCEDGRMAICDFMEHLNGVSIREITSKEFYNYYGSEGF